MEYFNTLEFAQSLDEADPLSYLRDEFLFPEINGKTALYFTGNSLGLQPIKTGEYINEELESWKQLGVEGHFKGKRPWFHYHKFSKETLSKITGAKPGEVVAMNNLTTNLHLLMVSFYRPDTSRYKIIMEGGAFPSDMYLVETQVRYHGFDPGDAIIEIKPREGEYCLRNEDIIDIIRQNAESTALVLFSGVQYYTGQFFNIQAIARAAHDAGAYAGFDLAHAVGNVTLNLHDDEVDFAAWCSYKYLNSGPGNTAGIFVHENHGRRTGLPRFGGWWGHDEQKRFMMEKGFIPMEGADGWQLSNVNVLSTAAHLASLAIFDKAGIKHLRAKSVNLTGFLAFIINEAGSDQISIITPANPEERGCQLSLVIHQNAKDVFDYLTRNGVVVDWREPDVIRVAAVPLYNTYEDVYRFGVLLRNALTLLPAEDEL